MIIKNISLKNFRNYEKLELEFSDRLNIIIGNNAQGKTNILESIYFLSVTKSFLYSHDKALINNKSKCAILKGKIIKNNNSSDLSVLLNNLGKKIQIGNNEIKKISDYIGTLRVIVFNPDNIRMLKDGPNFRRKFLNIEISQLYKKYIILLNEFNELLRQRNEYLRIIRNGKVDNEYLDVINNKFASLSKNIYLYRKEFIDNINKNISNIYNNIFNDGNIRVKYVTDINVDKEDNIENEIIDKLRNNLDKEIIYGLTTIGPHRDDFIIYHNNMDVSSYCSQGQLRGIVLSLKLSEIEIFKSITSEYPIVLLDDIFSELDLEKRNKLIKFLNKDIQIIITTTDINNIDIKFLKNANIYEIKEGKIIKTEGELNGRK